MRTQGAADDRQRVIHLLTREGLEEAPAAGVTEHLSVDDLAALLSGTLFKTEAARIENHLLACAACRAEATELHEAHEAGMVPILLRRAATLGPRPFSLREKIARRYSPLLLALAAFLLVVAVPFSITRWLSRGVVRIDEPQLVLQRIGTPVVRTGGGSDDDRAAAETGAWLEDGDTLLCAPGDVVTALRGDGVVRRITGDGAESEGGASPLLAEIFRGSWKERERDAREAIEPAAGPLGSARRPRVIHPRGRVLDRRPVFRWADESAVGHYRLTLARASGGGGALFTRDVEGRHLAYPRPERGLEPGRRYRVEIRTPPLATSSAVIETFEVVADPEREQLESELRRLDDRLGRAPHLLRADYLRQHNLHGEAREELERLRVLDSANIHLLGRLKVVLNRLGLHRDEERALKLIRKRSE